MRIRGETERRIWAAEQLNASGMTPVIVAACDLLNAPAPKAMHPEFAAALDRLRDAAVRAGE